MNVPRLRYWDSFFIFQEGAWHQMSPEDVVAAFNGMADRYEIILDDIEEILSGDQRAPSEGIHSGFDVPAQRAIGTA